MTIWDSYPSAYRRIEVDNISRAIQAGECFSLIGLSGAGKSNLLGYITNRVDVFQFPSVFVDCNRLSDNTSTSLFRLIRHQLGDTEPAGDEFHALDVLLERRLSANSSSLCLILDRFDVFNDTPDPSLFANLRSLRDTYKYRLTYITGSRRPLDPLNELAELFYAHVLWLGPLSDSDTRWNIQRYAHRVNQDWGEAISKAIMKTSRGYPSLLRASCEVYASSNDLKLIEDPVELSFHPIVKRRVEEFWADHPSDDDLRLSALDGLPLLEAHRKPSGFDTSNLTAKENLLIKFFLNNPDVVCEKDDLIKAVWPEDRIFEQGIRDDSLAQLVRRLRVKIEPDPSTPQYIHTVPGRGYRFTPQ